MSGVGAFNQTTERLLRLPERISEPGLLVGWSLEAEAESPPWGFSFGSPEQTPSTGFVDPVLLSGEGHLITIAPTGQGKGRCCIIPALLRHDGPVIVIDPKGENYAVTAQHRRSMGQKVVLLDPFGITGAPTDSFNPLDLIDVESVDSVDLATRFAHGLANLSSADPRNAFWYQRATFLLTSLILHVCCAGRREERVFSAVRSLLGDLSTAGREEVVRRAGDRRLEELRKSRHPAAREVVAMMVGGARETLGSILANAEDGIGFLRGPQVVAATAQTSFDLEAVTRGDPLSIYLVVPPHLLESHGRLLRLWVMALVYLLTKRTARPKKTTLFLLDEAAQLGPLAELRQAVTLLRGYGVQTWSFWQDATQLQNLYPQDWPTIVNNCAVVQCFGAQNRLAAEGMAQLVALDPGAHLSSAQRTQGDGLIRSSADRILALNSYEMALQIGGRPAIVARKPDYLSDPPFAGQFGANPFHDPDRDILPPPPPRMKLHDGPAIEQPPPVSAPAPAGVVGQDWPEFYDPSVRERRLEDPYLLERLLELWAA